MTKKKWRVTVTVNNSGLDFDDDVTSVILETDASVEQHTIAVALDRADKVLRIENSVGECSYDYYGWNCKTLMDEVCHLNEGWTWHESKPDIEFTIG